MPLPHGCGVVRHSTGPPLPSHTGTRCPCWSRHDIRTFLPHSAVAMPRGEDTGLGAMEVCPTHDT